MSKQFVKGNVYVFTKKKYMKESCKTNSKSFVNSKIWVDQINGNKVTIDGNQYGSLGKMGMLVVPEWCKCIKNNNPKIESEAI
ncbi:hypothetical protein LGL08_20740 [Clostridium estertheticum]|uniref:hypothetical protein n=1 Tax=Clostridium estertheticum TaxID=238834 RepID=UPI001CF5467C|nr:hypothetical protein [Clostridium estertheticum]MCB2308864.1 hypothetical protein [Clostridium estertheticum]MCB2347276.1 hypothetical protein [Clostridium estertheticum]MCB2351957.1 hypothetical protein [Clostridium estertheticum]WAG48479.1 hypothetical protein LL127_23440 [Clostridium estertheticum]